MIRSLALFILFLNLSIAHAGLIKKVESWDVQVPNSSQSRSFTIKVKKDRTYLVRLLTQHTNDKPTEIHRGFVKAWEGDKEQMAAESSDLNDEPALIFKSDADQEIRLEAGSTLRDRGGHGVLELYDATDFNGTLFDFESRGAIPFLEGDDPIQNDPDGASAELERSAQIVVRRSFDVSKPTKLTLLIKGKGKHPISGADIKGSLKRTLDFEPKESNNSLRIVAKDDGIKEGLETGEIVIDFSTHPRDVKENMAILGLKSGIDLELRDFPTEK